MIATWDGPRVTIMIEQCDNPFEVNAGWGVVIIREGDDHGRLVGAGIKDIRASHWDEDEASRFLGLVLGCGTAAPILAMRETCPDETMRDLYRRHWGEEPPF